MASTYCGVSGCMNNSRTTAHLSFFSLPKDERREKWIELMDRNDILNKKKTRFFVCSTHFTKDMFRNKRLKPGAVPSLNLPGSKVIPCRSSTQEYVETQDDKPVIGEMVQVKLPTTMEKSTQMQTVYQEKQTQTHENISTKQCQCYSQIQTNSYIVALTETQTEGHNTSEEDKLIHVEKTLTPRSFPSKLSLDASDVDVEDFIKVEARSDSNDSNPQSNENDNTSEMSESNYPVIEHSESVHSDDCIRLPEPKTLTKRTLSFAPPISLKRLREETGNDVKLMMREMSNKIDALVEEKKEDYYDSFGKYIASLLRSIPKERAMMLQPQVISLIVSGSGVGEGSVSQSDKNDI